MVETVTTALMDRFPKIRHYKLLTVIACCTLFFLLGLTLTTNVSYLSNVQKHELVTEMSVLAAMSSKERSIKSALCADLPVFAAQIHDVLVKPYQRSKPLNAHA